MQKFVYFLVVLLSSFILCACSISRQARSAPEETPELIPAPVHASASSEVFRIQAPRQLANNPDASVSRANLWALIAAEYRFASQHYDRPRVKREINRLQAHADVVHGINERAKLFLYYIYHELKKREMPSELALLPAIESGYDPYAYSPAGASGLWQFTSSTGHSFGLNSTWWYSQRRDIEISTKSALDYLQYLYDRYHDWELVLAAYNTGERRVNNALAANRARNRPLDYWHLDLPRETERYVPRLIAFAQVFASDLPDAIPNQPFWVKVHNDRQIPLDDLLDRARLDPGIFYMLNADQNQWLSSPHKDFLLIPITAKARVRRALATFHAPVRWVGYQMGADEDWRNISRKFNLDDQDIRQFNDVAELTAGNYLLVPLRAEHYTRLRKVEEQFEPLPPLYIARTNTQQFYHVRRGDNLWTIARAHGVSVQDMRRWNNIPQARFIYPDQVLLISAPQRVYEPAIRLVQGYNREVIRGVYYRVRRGDTLYGIASKFGVSINEIQTWNQRKNLKNYVYPGQHIKIYVDITDL